MSHLPRNGAPGQFLRFDGSDGVPDGIQDTDLPGTIARTSQLAGGPSAVAHHSTHQHGGTDEVATATPGANVIPKAGSDGKLAQGFIPPHHTTHEDGGSDEISVAGLSGVLADPQAPAAHTHAESDVTGLVTDLAGKVPTSRSINTTIPLSGGGSLVSDRTLSVLPASTSSVGVVELATDGETAASVVVQGNDSRLSNARTPTAHATSHEPGGGDAMAVDAAAGTGSLRTLGASSTSACAGNDSRLSDSRSPTTHHTSHENGGSDEIDVTGLSGLLADAQTPASHTHPESDITGLVTDLAGKVATSRSINTTIPLSGGGSLVSDRTLSVLPASTSSVGVVELATDGEVAANVVVQGNDSRLSDTRTPTDNTVSTAKIQADAVTYAKIQNVSATDKVLGRSSSGAGDVEEIACTAAGRALIDDAAASDQRTTLGLGNSATKDTGLSAGQVMPGDTKLDDLATPDDNTDLNRTTGHHGLGKKLSGDANQFENGSGAWTYIDGAFIKRTYLTGSGTHTTDSKAAKIRIEVIAGGGGGGGSATAASSGAAGGGGGAGGYAEKGFNVAPSTGYSYAAGAGGAGGTAGANDGSDGSDSTMTVGGVTVTAKGGKGGKGMAAGSAVAWALGGAATAVSTSGAFNGYGAPGGPALRNTAATMMSGSGANSQPWGAGGQGRNTQGDGNAAVGNGAGGGGGCTVSAGSAQAGGAGADGLIIVTEYAG